jgi:hypothetical protein
MITLQFSSTDQIGSKAIQFVTWSWASHVDFVLPDGKLLGALAIDQGGGVKYHDMKPLSEYARVERYEIDAPDSVLDFARSQLDKPYDWLGLIGILTRNRRWEDDDKWFCSELVAWSFLQAGKPLLIDTSYRITPRDLLISPLLKPIPLAGENK